MTVLINGVNMQILKKKINENIQSTVYVEQVGPANVSIATNSSDKGDEFVGYIYCTYLGVPNRDKTEDIARVLADSLRKIDGLSPEKNKRLTIKNYSGETNEICFSFNIEKYAVEKKLRSLRRLGA